MSRADRIVQRKTWFEAVGSWFRPVGFKHLQKSINRKSWQQWVLEWKHLHTHDPKQIESYRQQWERMRKEHADAKLAAAQLAAAPANGETTT